MLYLLLLGKIFLLKVSENMFDAMKIMFLQRKRFILSGCVLFLAALINYYVMRIIVSSDGFLAMITAAAAASTGYIIAGNIGDVFAHEIYIHIIMCADIDAIQEIHNFLTKEHIKHVVEETYDKDLVEKTLTIMAFPKTRGGNRRINDFIKNSPSKFGHVIVQ